MAKYKVLKEVGMEGEKPHEVGSVIDFGQDNSGQEESVAKLLADGFIELVAEPISPVKVDYVVANGPFANPSGEVFQTGNAIQFDEGDVFAEDAVKAGLIMTKAAHDALPKEPEVSTVGAPTTPAVAGNSEPRLRYRGKIVLVDSKRVVGVQTFHHIRTEEGHEYDLTPSEYAGEVKMSYPPQG